MTKPVQVVKPQIVKPLAIETAFKRTLSSTTPLTTRALQGFAVMAVSVFTVSAAQEAHAVDVHPTLPTYNNTASGTATTTYIPNTRVTIDQVTDKAVIDWDDFDTANGKDVIFNTPTGGITLNAGTLNVNNGGSTTTNSALADENLSSFNGTKDIGDETKSGGSLVHPRARRLIVDPLNDCAPHKLC